MDATHASFLDAKQRGHTVCLDAAISKQLPLLARRRQAFPPLAPAHAGHCNQLNRSFQWRTKINRNNRRIAPIP